MVGQRRTRPGQQTLAQARLSQRHRFSTNVFIKKHQNVQILQLESVLAKECPMVTAGNPMLFFVVTWTIIRSWNIVFHVQVIHIFVIKQLLKIAIRSCECRN